jgi:uroporphyrin-III C-methyltransferase/precorrin-2 dehydrogenase/sirohydrochlorin ferrochelatase
MFIRTTGRTVVIFGGGEQATQKARLIAKTDAMIVLVAAQLDQELAALVRGGGAHVHDGPVMPLLEDAAMAFCATGCPGADAAFHGLCKAARCPVNVVDQPALCELITPSIVDRDPVVVAIGTEGTGPVLARQIKTQLEEALAPNLGGLAALAGKLRPVVADHVTRPRRRAFWRWVFADAPRKLWDRGAEAEATQAIEAAIAAGRAPDTRDVGSVAVVGAGPGARDLLTLRAVQRLQEADVIFYDADVDAELLELARRDAERVALGETGAAAWRQQRVGAEARRGNRVVHLVLGDPSAQAAGSYGAGWQVELVPGVAAPHATYSAAGNRTSG